MAHSWDGCNAVLDRSHVFPDRQRRINELGRDLINAAFLRGDFLLASGSRTSYFFDKFLFETKPGILRRIASFLAEMVPPETDRLAGPELGAVPIVTALSLETGLPFVIVKKASSRTADGRTCEGEVYSGERITVVEDVVTSGSEAIRSTRELVNIGAQVVAILAVLDREEGAQERLTAAGFLCSSLFRRRELGL